MKKVLTLVSALSMVAGSAFANDYDWKFGDNGVNNPKTDANHNVLIGDKAIALKYENKKFTFSVNAGDQIKLGVNGKDLHIAVNGTPLTAKLEGGLISFDATADGTVELTLSDKTAITSIYVESDNYRTALAKIKNIGKAAINNATIKIADYSQMKDEKNMYRDEKGEALSFMDFFSAIKGEINIEAQKVAQMEAELVKAKQENTVGVLLGEAEGEGKLVTRLTAVDNAITQILNDATAAKANYDNIIQVVAKGVNDRLAEAAKTTVSSYDNNALTYIWDFQTVNRKIQKDKLKAPWAETELAAIVKDRNELMKAAWEELGRFPKQTKAKAEWETDFNSLKDQVDNMIARAIVERVYKSKISNLKTKVGNLKDVLAIKDTDHKDVFTKPAGYDDWTKAVDELNKFIDDATNRRDFTKAELDANPVGKYTTAETTFTSLKGEFINQAYTELTARSKAAQEYIDTKSYAIAAKYQNEPKTQETYEKEFAVIQADLNTCNNKIKAKDYATIVEHFTDRAKEISRIHDLVTEKWNSTLSDQKLKVKKNNEVARDTIVAQIDAVRKNYNDYIAKIELWKKADFSDNDMVASLNEKQRRLFDIVGELDTQRDSVVSVVAKLEEVINGTSDVEFDPNDATKYRFDGKNKDGKTYEDIVKEIEGRIDAQIDLAVAAANDRAWYYLNREWANGKTTLTLRDADWTYNNRKEYIDKGYSESKMTKKAHDSFDKRYQGILDKSQNDGVGENYRADALAKAIEYKNANTLADSIGDISKDYLSKIEAAVTAVNSELEAYTDLYQQVAEKKVAWTVAKSKETVYQDEYEKVVPNGKADFVKEKLEEINTILKKFSEKLEDNALTASTLKDEAKAELDKFADGYFQATNYEGYVANNEAKDKAKTLIAVVKAEITNAKAAIAGYREEVKAEANVVIAAAETTVAAQETSVETDFAAGTLGKTYASIEGALNTVSAKLKKALADAEKAEKGGNLDLDGDGEISTSDVLKAVGNVKDKTMDLRTFTDFIDAYFQYISK